MKRHMLALTLTISGFTAGVSLPQSSDTAGDALFDIFAKRDGHWQHFGPVWNGTHEGFSHVTLALETLTHQGWEIVAITSRNGFQSIVASTTQAAPVAVAPQSQFGTACPGYPHAPFPNAQCYADGGWR